MRNTWCHEGARHGARGCARNVIPVAVRELLHAILVPDVVGLTSGKAKEQLRVAAGVDKGILVGNIIHSVDICCIT